MENNDFENNADLYNLFLKLLSNTQERELLLLLMQNKNDQIVYETILENLRNVG